MADVIKVLGQLEAAATTEEDLYEVPSLTVATCSTLAICNRTAGALTFRVSVAVAGGTTANQDYIYYDKQVSANDSLFLTIGMTLNEGDVVRTYASATGLSFNLFGVETTND
jgi:hypothetical protein